MSNPKEHEDIKASQLVDALSPTVDAGGRLKIFFGYAPGVGKTHEMLDESLRRKKRGQDIVVGFLDARRRPYLSEMLSEFEVIPSAKLECQGTVVEEMDVEAILRRNPGLVIVDDLAHTNCPGSLNAYRWQDVEQLLENHISVLATLNVINLESLKDAVAAITGTVPSETVPDRLFREADEVELVDITPRALVHRLERGDLYKDSEAPPVFSEESLLAMRELALREVAGQVDEDVELLRRNKKAQRPWAVHDRVMICLTSTRSSMRLIRRGWRISQRMHADIFCVYVEEKAPNEREKKILQDDFNLAAKLNIPTVTLQGGVAAKLVEFAKEKSITHIVLGHSDRTRLQEIMQGSIINALTRDLKTVDILIVAAEAESAH